MASLEALAAVHADHGHLQEVILQNYVPHPSYYGREPAQIADAAQGGERRRAGSEPRPRGRPRSRSTTCGRWCASRAG